MKIALLGYGKMGREIEQVALSRGHYIVVRIDNENEWNTQKADFLKTDVAIEFSTPATAVGNILKCFENEKPVVCGTTGWTSQVENIKEKCLAEKQALFHAPNFSIGMNFVFHLNREMAAFAEKYNYKMSVSETHHIHKLDKPSGTAVALAEDILRFNGDYKSWRLGEADSDNILSVNAIRYGECFGKHEVKAKSDFDEITLEHEAFSRKSFATGAVIAAEFLQGKTGYFTMNDLLNF